MAVLLAAGGAGWLLVADFYTSLACTPAVGGGLNCVTSHQTLIEHEGPRVLWLLAVPIAVTGLVAALLWMTAWKPLEWSLAGLLLAACMLTGLTIGSFFLPAALCLLAAVALDRRPSEEPQ
jgi:hypothetical protein